MKWVLDTNVIFSGTISTSGRPHQVLRASFSKRKRPQLIYSKPIYKEYERKLKEKAPDYGATKPDIIFSLEMIKGRGILVEPEEELKIVEEDPDDNKFFECAVKGGAKFIVSGDPHILNIEEFRKIKCLEPGKAVKTMGKNPNLL